VSKSQKGVQKTPHTGAKCAHKKNSGYSETKKKSWRRGKRLRRKVSGGKEGVGKFGRTAGKGPGNRIMLKPRNEPGEVYGEMY